MIRPSKFRWKRDRQTAEEPHASNPPTCIELLRVLRDGSSSAQGGCAHARGAKQIAVLFTGDAFVEGQVQLPNRKLLIRFQYDFKMHGVDLGQAIEWADVNNDD